MGGRPPAAMLVAVAALLAAAPAEAAKPKFRQRAVTADFFTQATPARAAGQIELITLSTPAAMVTGGDVLVAVRGLRPGDRLVVWAGKRRIRRGVFGVLAAGERRGLISGLREGVTALRARVRRGKRRMQVKLAVRNHPIRGPVVSGPHQRPFYCETERSGLGRALDRDCSARTKVEWYYRSTDNGKGYRRLASPFTAYPSDVARTRKSDGSVVPFVVRLETSTINRGITRMALLDDPRTRGRGAPFRAARWNRRVTHAFGESCGVGYRQGTSSPDFVLGGTTGGISADTLFASLYGVAERLARGDLVTHSTMTSFGVYCNPLVSAETLAMIKETVIERYGPPRRFTSVGASGGALQTYNAVNNAPGLLDGGIVVASFADIPSTAMSVVDCGLIDRYFRGTHLAYNDPQKQAIAGHATASICRDWVSTFLPNLDPHEGCSGRVPRSVRYHATRNPAGVRCTLQDATVNIWGRDPATGFARRPYDNVGVQYGLRALQAGVITGAQFVDLNRNIGSYDLDARHQVGRVAMDEATAARAYRLGGVIGRGALSHTPVIDLASYLDLIPVADIHDVVRPFQVRARLAARGSQASQSIWRGISLPGDAQPALTAWMDGIARAPGARSRAVATAKPAAARDRCIAAAGIGLSPDALTLPLGLIVPLLPGEPREPSPLGVSLPQRQEVAPGICQTVFPAKSGTRIVAGGPFTDDVIKCRLKPIDISEYGGRLTGPELDRLRGIFPQGVCDWSRPGVGDVEHSMLYPSLGGAKLARRPREIRWRAAQSLPPRRSANKRR